MDLRSLMNTDGAEGARATQQRESMPQAHPQSQSQSQSQAHARTMIQPPPPPPPRAASGSYGSPPLQHMSYAPKPTPPLYQHQQQQQQQHNQRHHQHQHSSIDSHASSGALPSARLTPLHTPVQTPGQIPGGTPGYPFPSAPYQSPSQAGQQYRSHDAYQVATPGGSRPPAPLYQHGQPPASSPYAAPQPSPGVGVRHPASHTSMSPTPPMLHRQSSQPVRESPVSASQPYGHPYAAHPQHPSQPSTPLGPPSAVQYPRPFVQTQSPYAAHHRTSSGASHGPPHSIASNSPAQPMALTMAMGNMLDSPAAYGAHSQPQRVASGTYVAEAERERSISVSPKTRVVPRTGSQASFYSSHDPMSARNSLSAGQPDYDRLSHQPQPEPQHLRSSGDMSHAISPLTNTRPPPASLQAPPAPSPSSRSSQTPKLVNLLNDTGMAPSPVRQSPAAPSLAHQPQHFSPQSQHTTVNGARPSSSSFDVPVKLEPPPLIKTEASAFARESLLQQPVTTPTQPPFTPIPERSTNQGQPTMPTDKKRPAESLPESAHPVKRAKKRYAEPPIWARFAKSNPRYGDNPQSLAPPPQQLVRRPSPHANSRTVPAQQQQAPPTNGHGPQAMANGHPSMGPHGKPPAAVHPRLGPWETNVRNTVLINDLVKDVGDFLFFQSTRPDIGVGDLRSGTLEIEAKFGTLIDKRTNNRVATLGISNMVLDAAITSSGHLRFESFMTELQHKQMNDYLNAAVQASMQPGRVKMNYKHRYERDSFAQLNQHGLAALPQAAKAHLRPGQIPKLRTSVDTKAPKGSPQAVLGRIVKVRLDDLDIHCPKMDFDCRISVNVEVDLNNRPDVDPSLIIDQLPLNGPDAPGDRMKDRLSYQHLAYSIDLTQVTAGGGKKSHELEIEVDTAKLREEASRLQEGADSGYEAMVDGLLSNVFMLMRASKDMGKQGGH